MRRAHPVGPRRRPYPAACRGRWPLTGHTVPGCTVTRHIVTGHVPGLVPGPARAVVHVGGGLAP